MLENRGWGSRGEIRVCALVLFLSLFIWPHLLAQEIVVDPVEVQNPAGGTDQIISPNGNAVDAPPEATSASSPEEDSKATPSGAAENGAVSQRFPNDILKFHNDLFTGRFVYEVPILVPPARQGTEPKLALVYNSSAGNGWCGVGWALDLGSIERNTRDGVPVKWSGNTPLDQYDDAEGFVVNLGGANGNLINVGGNEYRLEIDQTFHKFVFDSVGNFWEVTDKGGVKFFFGESAASRMQNTRAGWIPDASSTTFRWSLCRILDPNGNQTTLSYVKFNNQIYPERITYNTNINSAANIGLHTIDFVLEDRPDQPFSYRAAHKVQTTKRLTNIVVRTQGGLVRRYALQYTTSPSTLRSLLEKITVYGTNDIDSLPPLTFTYQQQDLTFKASQAWPTINSQEPGGYENWYTLGRTEGSTTSNWTPIGLADIDGDGLPDRVMRNRSSYYNTWVAQRNTGSGFNFDLYYWQPISSFGSTDEDWNSLERTKYTSSDGYTKVRFLDVNGDGYPDRILHSGAPPYNTFYVETNKGLQGASAFSGDIPWGPVTHESTSTAENWLAISSEVADGSTHSVYVDLFDITGDGLPDRVMRQVSGFSYLLVQKNTGSGFSTLRRYGPLLSQGITDQHWNGISGFIKSGETTTFLTMIDLNGDGLVDRVMRRASPPYTNFMVQFNTGDGFSVQQSWGPVNGQGTLESDPVWRSPYASFDYGMQVALRDVNGDGLPDRVMRKRTYPYNYFKIQLNTGSGFAETMQTMQLDDPNNGEYPQGNGISANAPGDPLPNPFVSVKTTDLFDINGDGLPDRVKGGTNAWAVELSKGPFPDLLSKIQNGIGGKVDITYAPSTQFNNRNKEITADPWLIGAKALLPQVVYVVQTVSTRDGFGNTNTTTYAYRGGRFDSKRREFCGFNRVRTIDRLGTQKIYFFHQGGGWNGAADGEYLDNEAVAKKGIPYRVETVGSDGLTYNVTVNKVEETVLHSNGWCFPFISQTVKLDYEGLSNYRASAQRFNYDTASGNLTLLTDLGEVTQVNVANHTFTDDGLDSVYTHTTYASLGDIKNRPERVKTTADLAGSQTLREQFMQYDLRGNLTNQQAWLSNSFYITTSSSAYDSVFGNPIYVTDAAKITTTNIYETAFQTFVAQKIITNFVTSVFTDPRSGNVLQTIDAKGLVSSNIYDVFFRLTESRISTEPYGQPSLWREKYVYTLGGSAGGISTNSVLKRILDPPDPTAGYDTYTYADGLGRLIQTRSETETGLYRVVDTLYDERGNPNFVTYPYLTNGIAFTPLSGVFFGILTEYDAIARANVITPAMRISFDASGNFIQLLETGGDTNSPTGPAITAFKDGSQLWVRVITDAENKKRKEYLDARGHIIQVAEVTSGGNFNTYYKYDLLGNLTNLTDHAGNLTRMTYDGLGRKTGMVDPDMGTWSYWYDAAGRMIQQFDAKNQHVDFFYSADPLGRLVLKIAWDAAFSAPMHTYYTYDSAQGDPGYNVSKGQLYKITSPEGWTKFSYDARGRVTNETVYVARNGQTYQTATGYDDADRIKTLQYPGSPTAKIQYTYDTGRNISEIRSLAGTGAEEVFYSAPKFDQAGKLTNVVYGSAQQQVRYEYYKRSQRLKNKTVQNSGGVYHQNLTYTYDAVSNVKSITDAVRTSGNGSASFTNATYDDLHRLLQLTSTAGGTVAFTYDPIGNMTFNGEAGVLAYTYNASRPHAVQTSPWGTYTYDVCGNMTTRRGQTLVYDTENRLKQTTGLGGSTIFFGYNPDGKRLWRDSSSSGLTVWINNLYEARPGTNLCHVYAGDLLVASFQPRTEVPGSQYTFNYYHHDHLGSMNIVTDRSGNPAGHYQYGAYGRLALPSTVGVTFGYTSQPFDDETALSYYQSRYYDPELGRFIQPDTVVPSPVNPQSLNRYTYVLNNPLAHTDPSGHAPWYYYIPGIGPGIAEHQGNQALNAMAVRLGEQRGTGWASYNELRADLSSGTITPGNLSDIAGVAKITGGAADLYLIGAQEIATAGVTTPFVKVAAERMGEAPGFLSRLFGKQAGQANRTVRSVDIAEGGSSFWTKAEFQGTRVYQRNDLINPALVDARGRSNLQRMREGLAPIGPDGKSIHLHHTIQTSDSPLAEMTATFHQQNSRIIHINSKATPSDIDRPAFDVFRRDYWINRATDFSP
jgi:RHS repeat-associated protein